MARILVVDDEPNVRFLLRTLFELAGHEVDEAQNGVAAIRTIESGHTPDLVATDYMMPLMDGGELIARLRANPSTAHVPIILASSSPGSERKTAADLFVQKPFDPAVLIERAARLLEGSAG